MPRAPHIILLGNSGHVADAMVPEAALSLHPDQGVAVVLDICTSIHPPHSLLEYHATVSCSAYGLCEFYKRYSGVAMAQMISNSLSTQFITLAAKG